MSKWAKPSWESPSWPGSWSCTHETGWLSVGVGGFVPYGGFLGLGTGSHSDVEDRLSGESRCFSPTLTEDHFPDRCCWVPLAVDQVETTDAALRQTQSVLSWRGRGH